MIIATGETRGKNATPDPEGVEHAHAYYRTIHLPNAEISAKFRGHDYLHATLLSPDLRAKISCARSSKAQRERLYYYLWQVLENKKCHPYAINGIEDHLHIFTHIHQGISIADLVKDLKVSSSDFIKRERLFSGFSTWQTGYAIFTKSHEAKNDVVKYVKHQEEHHKSESSTNELRRLLGEEGVGFDERYLE